jgi:glycosyltransferase involved in cell wall biosynthesis
MRGISSRTTTLPAISVGDAVPETHGSIAAASLRVAMILYGDLTFDSRVQREANSLVRAGHAVTIFCLAGAHATASMLDPGVDVHLVTVDGRTGSPRAPSPFLAATGAGRAVKKLTWLGAYVLNLRRWGRAIARTSADFDVWHAHDFTGLVAGSIAKSPGSGLVYDVHDLVLESGTGARLPGPLRRALRWYERRLVQGVDLVVTVNHGLEAYIDAHLRPPSIVVVHNCVPTWSSPEPRPAFIRDAAGIAPTEPVILYHGLVDANRGIDALYAAILEPGLEHAHLVLLGFGPDRERLLGRAADPAFNGRIHLLDAVPPAELIPWVASADVGVMPNQPRTLNERLSTPNKLFESIAAGLPVVSSDFPERRRIIIDDPLGSLGAVCDPTDPRALARAIHSIIGLDVASLSDLRRRCSTAAAERWNWESEAEALLDGYRTIAVARGQGTPGGSLP